MNMITLAPFMVPASGFGDSDFGILLMLWGKTIGWAVAGGIGMGLGLIVSLKIFTLLTRDVDEWALIKSGNIPIGIVLGCVILGTSLVIALCAMPGH